MTKLSIFDKIEEAKKSTVLSQNDKIEHFLTKLKKRKNTQASHKMTKWVIFDKIVLYITTHSVHKVYLCLSHNLKSTFQTDKMDHFWQNWKSETKYTLFSYKMTKLSIFDKTEES